MGLGSVRMTGADWRRFDRTQAREWLRLATSDRAVDVIWDPLLSFKFGTAERPFPASWMAARFRQRASARTLRGERLGYLRGGFRQLFDGSGAELERLGADVQLGTGVERIEVDEGRVLGVTTSAGTEIERRASCTPASSRPGRTPSEPTRSTRVCPAPANARGRRASSSSSPSRSVTRTGRTSASTMSPSAPSSSTRTSCPADDYGGRHIVYLGRYFTPDDPLATADPRADVQGLDRVAGDACAGLLEGRRGRRASFPHALRGSVVSLGYRHRLLPVRSHVDGLFVATTAQIYPEDRGMNEGVRLADVAAEAVMDWEPKPRTARTRVRVA